MQRDRVWTNARLATLDPALPGLGVIEAGAVAARAGQIAYAGPAADLPADWRDAETTDVDRRWITPGLIDCHTHLVFGGNRADEFQRRLAGATYTEIAQAGGGIASTVRATRAADEAALLADALVRLDELLDSGVTTVEVKSGYGLDLDTERRLLRVARRLGEARAVSVATTFLGAHTIPPGVERAAYVAELAERMIPQVAAEGLADAVDAFCERIAFSVAETETVLRAAQRAGLPVKIHAEQLSHLGGTALAARLGALSADHLEYATDADAAALAASGTVAVLLPGAFHMLRETRHPPVAALRAHGARIAIATDCNPGTSPLSSLTLAMNLACVLFGLTVEEAIIGTTRNAAMALGRLDQVGTLEVGKRADLAIWSVNSLAELPYRMGARPLHARVVGGAPDAR